MTKLKAVFCRAMFGAATVAAFWGADPALADEIVASARARQLAKDAIVVDGHVDYPMQLLSTGRDPVDAGGVGEFDYVRAMAGGFNAPFMSIYVSSHFQETGGAKEQADILIGLIEGVAARHPGKFEISKSPADVRRITSQGKIALSLGMENGAPIGGDLNNLDHFYARGIRYVTLTHSVPNHLSDSSSSERRLWGGLSPFGELAVARLNDLGVMIDVSHISDEAFFAVMEKTRAPVIASHSSVRKFTPGFGRNMSDDMIRALAGNRGIIMINFGSHFLTEAGSQRRMKRPEIYRQYLEERELSDTPATNRAFRAWFDENVPVPFAHLNDVLDHIDHVVGLVGVDHVGLGSDFDGVGDTLPVGLKHVGETPNLVQGLIDRGYSESDIRKILGENLLRVWGEVEKAARGQRRR